MDDSPTYSNFGEWSYRQWRLQHFNKEHKELLHRILYDSAEIRIHWEPPGFSYAPDGWSSQLELWERQMREK